VNFTQQYHSEPTIHFDYLISSQAVYDSAMADTNPKTIRSTNQLLELNTSKDVETSKQSSSHTDTSNATLNYEDEYLTGIKLLATMFSLTLVGFLMLLDTSIIATVRIKFVYRQ